MKTFEFLTIFLLVPVVYGIYNERKLYKRQAPGPPPILYGGPPGQPLPYGVNPPLIPPTYGNDKGGGGDYQTYEDSNTLPGIAGTDYPIYGPNPPLTNFNCATAPFVPGYYADVEYACQVFHICEQGGKVNTFLCPNGTIYNQKFFVCDWWYNVNCAEATSYYGLNGELYKVPPGGYNKAGAGGGYVNGLSPTALAPSGVYPGGVAGPVVPGPHPVGPSIATPYGSRAPSNGYAAGPVPASPSGYLPPPAPPAYAGHY